MDHGQRPAARRGARTRAAAAAMLSSLLAGCQGIQSALDPAGAVAADIARLWWVLLFGAVAIYALTMGLLLYAVRSRFERRPRLRQTAFVVGGGLVFPTVVLTVLLIYATDVGRRIVAAPEGEVLRIEVTGHRWWWEVRYPADGGLPPLTTANEIHLPVGIPVEVTVRSADVIHSFWLPTLAGKMDAIPGRVNRLRLRADDAGTWRGQCAEFCGAQHARMALQVVAGDPGSFADWRRDRAAGAALAGDAHPLAGRGRRAFVEHDCADCHRVRGDLPGSGQGDRLTGMRGPDLTHVASRPALGALTLPYSRENAARWIRENQRLKPGNRMPDFAELPPETADAIAWYLDSLR